MPLRLGHEPWHHPAGVLLIGLACYSAGSLIWFGFVAACLTTGWALIYRRDPQLAIAILQIIAGAAAIVGMFFLAMLAGAAGNRRR